MQISQGYSSYQSSQVLNRFAIQTMKDSQDITSESVGKLLSSVEAVSKNVAQSSAGATSMSGTGGVIDVYA